MRSKVIPSLALLGLASAQEKFLLPPPHGQFLVSTTSAELVDNSRLDPFNSSHIRRFMISSYTPVAVTSCTRTCRQAYMPPLIADLEDAIISEFYGPIGWPSGLLAHLELEFCCDAASSKAAGKFPILIFGTGFNSTRLFYSASAQNVASMGFKVVVIDHPYETDVVVFPDGSVIYGGRVNTSSEESILTALNARVRDAMFVLDNLGIKNDELEKAGILGHSFGGAAAPLTMMNDMRYAAGVNLDGSLFGPVLVEGLQHQSFLLFGSEEHNYTSDATWGQLWETTNRLHPYEWMKELNIRGSVHNSYADFALIGDVAGLRDNSGLLRLVGNITGERMSKILREYLDDFFGRALRGDGEGLLAGPSSDYPEVEFLRSNK
jgi:pimeloyl-ACP methyl ester carboxylesterase